MRVVFSGHRMVAVTDAAVTVAGVAVGLEAPLFGVGGSGLDSILGSALVVVSAFSGLFCIQVSSEFVVAIDGSCCSLFA